MVADPGDARSQGISNHDIVPVKPRYLPRTLMVKQLISTKNDWLQPHTQQLSWNLQLLWINGGRYACVLPIPPI